MDFFQHLNAFLNLFRFPFEPSVLPQILLHGREIDFLCLFADIIGYELLNIGNRCKRNRLLQQSKISSVESSQMTEQFLLILIRSRQNIPLRTVVVLLEEELQVLDFHRQIVLNERILRYSILQDKEDRFVRRRIITVKHDPERNRFALLRIIYFADYVTRKGTVSKVKEAGVSVVSVFSAQVSFKTSSGSVAGCFIKETIALCIAQKNNLKSVNNR